MKADPAAQALLIELQAIDSRISEIGRLLDNHPQAARLREVRAEFTGLTDALRIATGQLEDTQAAVSRVEEDIRIVAARRAQDTSRLHQSSNTKEIQSFSAELETLARRLDTLEESQLELMQQAEDQGAEVSRLKSARDALAAEGRALQGAQAEAARQLTAERENLTSSRSAFTERIPGDLLAVYDRVRSRGYGIGAARIVNKVCGSCAIQLGPADFADFQKLTPADVAQCPQCSAILVRQPSA